MATRRRSTSRRKSASRRRVVRRRSTSRRRVVRRRTSSKSKSRRRRRRRSKSKSRRKANPHLKAWVKAAQAEGFMKKGDFKPLPKKGSPAYKRIRARYEAILNMRK